MAVLLASLLGGLGSSAQAIDVIGEEPTGCTLRAGFTIGDDEFKANYRVDAETYEDWGLICLVGTIHYVVNWIFYLLLIAALAGHGI